MPNVTIRRDSRVLASPRAGTRRTCARGPSTGGSGCDGAPGARRRRSRTRSRPRSSRSSTTPWPGSEPIPIPNAGWCGATTRARATPSSSRRRAGWSWSTSASSVPGEGPRAGGKVVRWQRVQLGELAVEIQGGHRLVTFQVETQVLNGADAAADAIAAFAQTIFAAVDGRPAPSPARREGGSREQVDQGRGRLQARARPRTARRLDSRRRDRPPDRGGDLRPGRRHRRLGDLVGRGPSDVRRSAWTDVDRRRPGRGHGRQLAPAGRGSCASGCDLDLPEADHRAGDRRRRRRALSTRGRATHRRSRRGGPADRRGSSGRARLVVPRRGHRRGARRDRSGRCLRGRRLVRRGRPRQAGARRLPRGGPPAGRRARRAASSSRIRSTASGPGRRPG